MADTTSPAGTIYDIGYRNYEGERLGRANAVRTILVHGIRTVFGFGRGEKAKLLPFGIVVMALLPAIIQSWVHAATGARLFSYEDYFGQVEFLFMIFCAAQAPELVSTDRHHGVLSLYFVRPLQRGDYALGKVLALVLAVLFIGLAGQATLFSGRLFGAEDLVTGWRAERSALLPILGATVIAAVLLAALSVAVASLVKARTLASAAVFATFLVAAALPPLLQQALGRDVGRYAILANPMALVSGTSLWLFDAEPRRNSMLALFDVPMHYFPIAAALISTLLVLALVHRYRRLGL